MNLENEISIAFIRDGSRAAFILKPELTRTIAPGLEKNLGVSLIVGEEEVTLRSEKETDIRAYGDWSLDAKGAGEHLRLSSSDPAGRERMLTGLRACLPVLDRHVQAETWRQRKEKTVFLRNQFQTIIDGLEGQNVKAACQEVREKTHELIVSGLYREIP